MTCAEKWTIIITALGVIATFSAVVVALWQTKTANRKKLKFSFSHMVYLIGFNNTPYCQIEISNVGNRKVYITAGAINITSEKKLQLLCGKRVIFISNHKNNAEFPVTLEGEDVLSVFIPLTDLYNAIITFKDEYLGKFTIAITDSTGKRHKCRCQYDLEAMLKNSKVIPNETKI